MAARYTLGNDIPVQDGIIHGKIQVRAATRAPNALGAGWGYLGLSFANSALEMYNWSHESFSRNRFGGGIRPGSKPR